MKFELTTKISFSCNLGRVSNNEVFTLSELGLTQEDLDTESDSEIEKFIQECFLDWQANHLDSGRSIVEED